MPKRKLLSAFKSVDIVEYDVRNAHPIVGQMRDVAIEWKRLQEELESERLKHDVVKAKYDMSAHFVSANEFYFLMKLANHDEISEYLKYWLRGPKYEDYIHSTSYYAVVDKFANVVSVYDSNRAVGVLRTPMHITLDSYQRFRTTRKPLAQWILEPVRNRCVSGIDYSEEVLNVEPSTEVPLDK